MKACISNSRRHEYICEVKERKTKVSSAKRRNALSQKVLFYSSTSLSYRAIGRITFWHFRARRCAFYVRILPSRARLAPVSPWAGAIVAGVAMRAQRAVLSAVDIGVRASRAGARKMGGIDEGVALGDDSAERPA